MATCVAVTRWPYASCPGSGATLVTSGDSSTIWTPVRLLILNLGIDTKTAAGRLIFSVVAAVAEMERELLIERTQSGLTVARGRGRVGISQRSFTSAQQREAQRLYDEPRNGHRSDFAQ